MGRMSNTSIIACGQKFDIGTKVVLWYEPNGFNGYDTSKKIIKTENRRTGKVTTTVVSGPRYSRRNWRKKLNLPQLRGLVTQFLLHHDGLYRARDTFNVLHNQRRLSVQFILDDDGTIYQTLDMKEKAWHAGKNNSMSVGIEIASRANARRFPDAYDEYHQRKYGVGPRKIRSDDVQGMRINGFEYNDKQYAALIKLAFGLLGIFPKMGKDAADFPRTRSLKVIKSIIPYPKKHTGFICHYNTSKSKWDPVAFDHERFLLGVKWTNRQKNLVLLKYNPGPIDGDFGPKTEKAVKKFQEDCSLVSDGIWGKKTQAAIEAALRR
jgi:hypothetical protein